MARADNGTRVGLTPYERDLLQGMVYVLVDPRAEDPINHVIGVFDAPLKAMKAAHRLDAGDWHHYCEHYWTSDGEWEITPYILNEEVQWKKKEWEANRPRGWDWKNDPNWAPKVEEPDWAGRVFDRD